jgi:DNA mismatch repair protein MutL
LSYALAECYRGFLPEKRHPLAVIGLTVPLADVDVNVHPGKREVRCRQEDRVFSSLQRAVRATLIATSPVPEVRLDGATTTAVGPAGSLFTSAAPRGDRRQAGMLPHFTAGESSPTPVEAMVSLRILGQVRNTYLAAEGPDGLYLIDQHAAHERVLFEQVSKGVSGEEAQVQSLLDPMAVELSPSQEDIVQASAGLLEKYGFLLEPFGERTYLLRAVPAVVKDASPSKALLEVLDLLAYEGLLKEREEALAASIACHTAVRAGMGLSQQEMEELIRQLESCDSPHTCPHGRPTMIHLSSHHLEREFGRR